MKLLNPQLQQIIFLNYPLDYFNVPRFRVKFERSCLKTIIKPFPYNKIINFYIFYEIELWSFHDSDKVAVRNSLFGTVNLIKNTDLDKYSYSGSGISFDIRGNFSLKNGGFGKNLIIFGADMNSSVHIDNKKKIF